VSLLSLPPTPRYRPLPARWKPVTLSWKQAAYLTSTARINYVYAGRRSFKTQAAKYRVVRAAVSPQKFVDARYFACAPVHQQAKDIFWDDIKALTPDWAFRRNRSASISESELVIELWNGARLKVAGIDKPQRIEGGFWDGGCVSEYADCKLGVFDAHIRPMMMRGGYIDLEGVPEGRNFFYDDVQRALQDTKLNGVSEDNEYGVFNWTTAEVLHLYLGKEKAAREIASAKAKLDSLTFSQEYEAAFVLHSGRAYYQFDRDEHCTRLKYDRSLPLVLAFDFNVDPGVCVYIQEQKGRTCIIGEVHIPKNSNTPTVCRRIIADWATVHKGMLAIYGDPAGGARSTKTEAGSDWDIVREHLEPAFKGRLEWWVRRSAPLERVRINHVNSRLKTADGAVHMLIDPVKAPKTTQDFEGVTLNDRGEIDKSEKFKALSHLTDGVGYYCHVAYPLEGMNITSGEGV